MTSVPEKLNQLVSQKCRHEYGHYIAARVLGFRTGNVTFRLTSENGDHVGTSEVMVQMPLIETTALIDYIERRVVVLFSGVMAETPFSDDIGGEYVEEVLSQGGGESDSAKITELVELHLNLTATDAMEATTRRSARSILMKRLRRRSEDIVRAEYSLIAALAAEHTGRMTEVTRGWAWGFAAEDLDAMAPIKDRFAGQTIDVHANVAKR